MSTEQTDPTTGAPKPRRSRTVTPEIARRPAKKVRRLLAVATNFTPGDYGFTENDLDDFERAYQAVHDAIEGDPRD